MNSESISAYDLPERVASYDADMELMHPNRRKMIEIALDVLPFSPNATLTVLDLGVGTGYFTERFLQAFPKAEVTAVDGSETMVQLARIRLHDRAGRVTFKVGDFRHLPTLVSSSERFDVVYTSYALHHLGHADKVDVVRHALLFLRPGGWFINADVIIAEHPDVEARIQELRVDGIVDRAAGRDERFTDPVSTRTFLDDLEDKELDQPLRLLEDLEILREAGLMKRAVFWLEYREAVTGGIK